MSRDLGTTNESASLAKVVRPAFFAEFDFSDGAVRVWTGIGDITTLSRTFNGLGSFGSISPIEEVSDVSPRGLAFNLSGVPAAQIALALGQTYRGRACRLWLGFFDSDGTTLLAEPYQVYSGMMDTMGIVDSIEASILNLSTENRLNDLQRPRTIRHSDEEQQRLFPGDRGCEYAVRMAEAPIWFGVPNQTSPAVTHGADIRRRIAGQLT